LPSTVHHRPQTTDCRPSSTALHENLSIHDSAVSRECKVVVVGASAVDITARPTQSSDKQSTTMGSVSLSIGGVGRNVAEACHRLTPNGQTVLISPIGRDRFGDIITAETRGIGMRTDGFLHVRGRTAAVSMSLDCNGGLLHGVADTGIVESLNSDQARVSLF
jgi:pseudouridylate synthase / pseudouridine kinase